MFAAPSRDQVIALSGLFQSAMLVYQLANKESHDEYALQQSSLSVLRINARSVEAVYSSLHGVSMGCEVVDQMFSGKLGNVARHIFQYAVSMHQLGLKLESFPHVSDVVQQRIEELCREFEISGVESDAELDEERSSRLYDELAVLYAKTISTLEPRIMVHGSQGKLNNPKTVSRVRSALFAGIRSAFLWHQLGGRRWQLMLHRRSYQSIAKRLARI
ncbi:MAG: lysogenization protein HflD [bacterium]